MPKEFLLPELAESVVEGEIVTWLVQEGESVAEDQPVVEVMTDKVTVELPSPYAGVLEKQLVSEGDIVEVGMPIAHFADGDSASTAPAQATETSTEAKPSAADDDSLSLFKASGHDEKVTVQVSKKGAAPASSAKNTGPFGRPLAVPAARKLARENNLALEDIQGSGPNGRIRVEDVRNHQTSSAAAPATTKAAAPSATSVSKSSYSATGDYAERETRTPLRGLRRVISQQMVKSHLETVRTLHVDEADVSALVKLRKRLKPLASEQNTKLSYMPFIVKAVVAGLKKFPMLNTSLDEVNNEIVEKHYYNIGMAVATDTGLVVPVIKDADSKTLLNIADDINGLADKARTNSLAMEDTQASTFSITNIGAVGGLFSFPIINVPEAAILGVHSIKKRAVVIEQDGEDVIVPREMLYLSLSFDHRLVDGAEAARFTGYVISLLENPDGLMLAL